MPRKPSSALDFGFAVPCMLLLDWLRTFDAVSRWAAVRRVRGGRDASLNMVQDL